MVTTQAVTGADVVTSSWTGDTCLVVEVEVEKDILDTDKLSIALAFLIGAIAGALVLLLCAKLCLKDFAKKKYQDAEAGYLEKRTRQVKAKKVTKKTMKEVESEPGKKKRKGFLKRKKAGAKKAKKGVDEDGPLLVITPVVLDNATSADITYINAEGNEDINPGKIRGLTDALMQTTGPGVDAEISEQDLDSVTDLERELREEGIMTMIQLLRTMLNNQLNKGKLSMDQCKEVLASVQENIDGAVKACQTEKEEEEEELRKKIKDPKKLQDELDKLHPKYMQKLNVALQEVKEDIRHQLSTKTDLSEAEVDALMMRHAEDMARLEHRLAMERARHTAALEERLARRKLLSDAQLNEKDQEQEELKFRYDMNNEAMSNLVEDGKVLERQKEEILKEYDEDLARIQMKHEEELQRQRLVLAEKLRKRRAARMKTLEQEQEEDRETFLKRSDRMTDTGDLVESYHDFLQQQRQQREDLDDDLDHQEAEEFHRLNKEFTRGRHQELAAADSKMEDNLKRRSQVSERDLERIMRGHQQEMEEFERRKKAEKKRARAILEEKLAQRRERLEEEQMQAIAEQKVLKEQQDTTLKKVLDSQIELLGDAREKIIREHEQNMASINNNLQMSRLRQQKALEQKLNARRAKVADLKQKAEETKRVKKDMKQKEKDKLEKELQKQIEEEEKKLEEDKKKTLIDFREQLASQTAEALKEQERQMGLVIARLQVGQARRQALIQRQDKTIKDLEDKLANHVAEKEVTEPSMAHQMDHHVDQLLQQHYNQVTHLSDRMAETRDRQEQLLQEKLQAKKLKKERSIEDKLEDEAQEEWKQQKRRGAGLATSLLGQTMLETRHRKAMQQLEKEMELEMQKQREELNRELEEDLEKEMEEHRKSFLAQIAALTNMSKDEVTDLVENAVADTGGDDREAKKLAKELRIGVKRAKTELDMEEDPSYRNFRRARTDLDEVDYAPQRPRSGKRRPKSAFKGEMDDYSL